MIQHPFALLINPDPVASVPVVLLLFCKYSATPRLASKSRSNRRFNPGRWIFTATPTVVCVTLPIMVHALITQTRRRERFARCGAQTRVIDGMTKFVAYSTEQAQLYKTKLRGRQLKQALFREKRVAFFGFAWFEHGLRGPYPRKKLYPVPRVVLLCRTRRRILQVQELQGFQFRLNRQPPLAYASLQKQSSRRGMRGERD